jgi:hypothetical protein
MEPLALPEQLEVMDLPELLAWLAVKVQLVPPEILGHKVLPDHLEFLEISIQQHQRPIKQLELARKHLQ